MSQSENFFEAKIKEIAKGKVIFDIGSGYRFQGLLRYKHYFSNCDYRTIDISEKCNPDIVADINNLPLGDQSADAIICKSVLQFVRNPFLASDEIFRVLKPGGMCLLYVPFLYPYHGRSEEGMCDYWRFSVDGVRELFNKFKSIEICTIKGQFETIANMLPLQKIFITKFVAYLARLLDNMTVKFQSGKQVSGYFVFLLK